MVNPNGSITGTVLKARFGDDVRKTILHHSNDLTLDDLLLAIQRIFQIQPIGNITLKYKDSDGDLITLADDSDLLLALHNENSTLSVHVSVDSKAHQTVRNVQQQLEQLKIDVGKLLDSLAPLDNLSSLVENCSISSKPSNFQEEEIVLQKNYEAPPSPVPSERQDIPATIQPSVQEHVLSDNHHRAEFEEDIPLENQNSQLNDSMNSNFANPPSQYNEPHQQQPPMTAPPSQFAPPTSIPSFPTSNQAPPQHHEQFAPPPFAPIDPNFNSGRSQSSVNSTPIPHGGPPPHGFQDQQHQHQFQPPPPQQNQQFMGPPQGEFSPQNFGPPQTPQGFAPPQASGPGQFAPPQLSGPGQFVPPPSAGPGQFAPPPSAGPGQFAPPQSSGPGQFAPPPSSGPGQFAPPPSSGPGQFVPPPSSGPGQFAPPPSSAPGQFAQPPSGIPGQFAPPPSGMPGQFAPPPGAAGPGGNPFARGPSGPGYRQSPYQQ